MGGRTPYFNPNYVRELVGKETVPEVLGHEQQGRCVTFRYRNQGATVVMADLIYSPNGGDRNEEWLRVSAELKGDGQVVAILPGDATHYFINLIDENNFLVSYREVDESKRKQLKARYDALALPVKASE